MSSDEHEDFEMTDADMDAAFGNRKQRKMTKNQRLYGIWAEEEEVEENRPSFSSGGKRKKDYTAPG